MPRIEIHERGTWDLVIDDMRERDRIGTEEYGGPLLPDNGRDSLVDAYQEALDMAVYLKNEIRRREWRPIETAPRDGTRLLLWIEGQCEIGFSEGAPYQWFLVHYGSNVRHPTHWQPLPEGPNA